VQEVLTVLSRVDVPTLEIVVLQDVMTETFTGLDGIPFATTTRVLGPISIVVGMSKLVEVASEPVATPIVL
jgi:hypothetical protein